MCIPMNPHPYVWLDHCNGSSQQEKRYLEGVTLMPPRQKTQCLLISMILERSCKLQNFSQLLFDTFLSLRSKKYLFIGLGFLQHNVVVIGLDHSNEDYYLLESPQLHWSHDCLQITHIKEASQRAEILCWETLIVLCEQIRHNEQVLKGWNEQLAFLWAAHVTNDTH